MTSEHQNGATGELIGHVSAAGEWFVRLPSDGAGDVQVFAFPQAGAGCATFGRCAAKLAGVADTWSVNLPGRQARFLEAPRTEIGPLVTELADALPRYRDTRPYAFVGYCSGALLAYRLAVELQERGVTSPSMVMVVSYAAPHRSHVDPRHLTASPEEFWRWIRSFGGVHELLATDATARDLFEPALRGDYALVASHQAASGPPLTSTLGVVAGRDDAVLGREDLLEWAEYAAGDFRLSFVAGDHWLLEEEPDALAGALARELSLLVR